MRLLWPNWRLPPAWRGRLRVERKIGEGASCRVYRCHLREDDEERIVAMKVMKADNLGFSDYMFRQEYKILSRLHGPSFIGLFDTGQTITPRGLVTSFLMELADTNLSELIKLRAAHDESVSDELVIKLMVDILRGLAEMEAQSLAHNDVTPQNILVLGDCGSGECAARLSDFGLADSAESRHLMHAHMEAVCCNLYLSPEAATGRRIRGDSKSDVWSAGMVFRELLTGRLPEMWESRSSAEAWERHPDRSHDALRMHVDTWVEDADLRQLLLRMLASEPWDRATARQALRAAQRLAKLRRVYEETGTSPFGPDLIEELGELSTELPAGSLV